MIEVIYKEENQDTSSEETLVQIPRNIRQVGQADESCKIYMEDYVYTFLVRLARSENKNGVEKAHTAVLIGETKWCSGTSYLFIRGALMTNGMEVSAEHIDFSEEIWAKIYEEQEKYFGEQEIVGWFFSQPQISMEVNEVFSRIHLKYFGGEKVLMIMEPQEREDAFFRYENGFMAKQGGYYVYYEKNLQMQSYMVEKNQELQREITEKYEDEAVKSFRRIISEKKQETEDKASVFSYAATACLAVAVVVVGANFYRSYQDMKHVETEIQQTSSIVVQEITPVPKTALDKNEKAKPLPKTKVETAAPANAAIKEKTKRREDDRKKTNRKERERIENETEPEKIEDEQRDTIRQKRMGDLEKEIKNSKKKREASKKKEEQNADAVSAGIHKTYVIKPGDTLFQISIAHYGNMDAMEEICRLNGLSLEEIIYPGQVIVLP